MTAFVLKLGGSVLQGRKMLLAAMAGMILAVAFNGIFLFYGRSADGAQAAPAASRKLSEDGQQRRLGWHAAVTVSDVEPRVATLLLLDRDGEPLKADAVIGQLQNDHSERDITFTPAGPSLWRAPLGALTGGEYLQIEISRPEGPSYRAEWRLPLR